MLSIKTFFIYINNFTFIDRIFAYILLLFKSNIIARSNESPVEYGMNDLLFKSWPQHLTTSNLLPHLAMNKLCDCEFEIFDLTIRFFIKIMSGNPAGGIWSITTEFLGLDFLCKHLKYTMYVHVFLLVVS